MWNPCWFHMNIYELCNQTSHMDCFNACLLWQKLGSIKWQGLTPCMTYKMAQGVTNAGWQKPGSIKWQGLNPCIHHKTGPLLWPLHCCGHCRCSLLALCCSKFFLGLALLLGCLWLLFEPMWNPCWFHMNIYELCNQTSHMDCFNACLLWQKPGSIKWQGLTPCMTYKMAQGCTQKPGSIKWQGLTPCIHHKTGPLLWPLHCCGHCRCPLLALCCSKFFLGLVLLLIIQTDSDHCFSKPETSGSKA